MMLPMTAEDTRMVPMAPMFDVTNMSFDELIASGDLNLAATIKRLTESLSDPDGIISAFQSLVSDKD
jgi:hypothetical protein